MSDDNGFLPEFTEEFVDKSYLNSVRKTRNSLETKVGETNKHRNLEIDAVLFLRVLEQIGGTFVWSDGPRNGDKFANIFEALATKIPGYDEKGLLDKGAHIEEYAPKLRHGFYSARKWLDHWYNEVIFNVPQLQESSIPTVLTFDPAYVLDGGLTAAEMQAKRDFKLANGQIIASARRLAASTKEKETVKDKLSTIVGHAVAALEDMRPTRD